MKHAIVFSTLLAAAAGFFALGDAQRDTYRAEMLAAASPAAPAVKLAANWQVGTTDLEDDADHDDGANRTMFD